MGAVAVRWHLCVLLALGAHGRLAGGSGLPGKPGPCRLRAVGTGWWPRGPGLPPQPLAVWRAVALVLCPVPPLYKVTFGIRVGRPLPEARVAPDSRSRTGPQQGRGGPRPRGKEEFAGGREERKRDCWPRGVPVCTKGEREWRPQNRWGAPPGERGALVEEGSEGRDREGVTEGKGHREKGVVDGGTDGQKRRH